MTLTKAKIIDVIHNQLGYPKNQSAELLEGEKGAQGTQPSYWK
jgi:hypothetical protein